MNASQEPAPPQQPGERPALDYGAPEAGYELAHPSGPADGTTRTLFGRPFDLRGSSPRPWRRTLVVAVVCLLVILVLGGPLGLLWRWLAPDVPVIDAGQAGVVVNDPSPEEYIAADGWFTLLGLAFGLLVAIVAWLVLRRDRGPFLLLSVVLGALGAGWLVAPRVGEWFGRADYQRWIETAQQGQTYAAPPEVHSLGPTLVPAFAAAIVLTLMAGWSNDPDLDQPGAKPGYGPNNDDEDPYSPTDPQPYRPADPRGFQPDDPRPFQPDDPRAFQPDDPRGLQLGDPRAYRPDDPRGFQPGDPRGYSSGEPRG